MEMFTYEVLQIIPVLGTNFTKTLKCFSDNAIDINVHFVWSLFDRYINKKKKVI